VAPEKEYGRAVEALKEGRVEKGRAGLERALEAAPDAEFAGEAWNWLGLARWQGGDLDGAAAAFEKAMEREPSDFRPPYHLGMVETERGDVERALGLFKQTIRLNPDGVDAMLALAELLTRRGKLEAAKSVYFQAEKRDAQSAAAMTGLGRAFLLAGDAARAETEFMRALETDRDYGPALYNLGVLHASEGRTEEAEAYFKRYLEAAPEGERAGAAKDRLEGGRVPPPLAGDEEGHMMEVEPVPPGNAAELWRKAEEEGSADGAVRALEAAAESGDPAGEEIAKAAVAAFGKSAEVQLAAGAWWERAGNRSAAAGAYRRAQALEPENADVLRGLGRVAVAGEEWDVAASAYKRLAQAEPGNADAWWQLAEIYGVKLGMTGRGVAIYREFGKRFASDPRAAEVEGRIEALKAAEEPLPEEGP
jgi:tetratricopeptide (TPR) repeat protein